VKEMDESRRNVKPGKPLFNGKIGYKRESCDPGTDRVREWENRILQSKQAAGEHPKQYTWF
jgi:hypothetical protein